jgi:Ner family transcriptional regulator
MSKTTQKWDRHSINAEVRRQGMTLTGIALDAGLSEAACRQGMLGSNRKGAEAIAAAINVPFRELFPDSYTRGRHAEERAKRKQSKPAKTQTNTAAA